MRETDAESRPSMRIRTSVCLDQSPEMRLNSDENETPCGWMPVAGFLMIKRWVVGIGEVELSR